MASATAPLSPNCIAVASSVASMLQQIWYNTKCYAHRDGNGWKKVSFDSLAGFPSEIQRVLAYKNTDSKMDLMCQLKDDRFVYCKVRKNSLSIPKYFRVYVASSMMPLREQAMSSSTRHQMFMQ